MTLQVSLDDIYFLNRGLAIGDMAFITSRQGCARRRTYKDVPIGWQKPGRPISHANIEARRRGFTFTGMHCSWALNASRAYLAVKPRNKADFLVGYHILLRR